MAGRIVRAASARDGARCAAIYAPFVERTAISFELEAPSPAEMGARIERAQERHEWLVVEEDGEVFGYAYAGTFNARAAYRFSCEVSVYVQEGRHGAGAGRALYEELLALLQERGYRNAIAGMTLPNPASEALHRALGFAEVGTYRRIGFKLGRWHDVRWVQRTLGEELQGEPAEPAWRMARSGPGAGGERAGASGPS